MNEIDIKKEIIKWIFNNHFHFDESIYDRPVVNSLDLEKFVEDLFTKESKNIK